MNQIELNPAEPLPPGRAETLCNHDYLAALRHIYHEAGLNPAYAQRAACADYVHLGLPTHGDC